MKKALIIPFLVILMQIPFLSGICQSSDSHSPYWYVGVSGGPNMFFGDVQKYKLYEVNDNNFRWVGGLTVGRQLSQFIGLRGQAMYGWLAGTNPNINRFFQAEYLEVNISATLDLSRLFMGPDISRSWNLYGFAGFGITNYRSKLFDNTTGELVKERGYFGDMVLVGSKYLGVAPAGLGLGVKLTPKLDLNLEYSLHILNGDWFDGFKDNVPYDMYGVSSLGLTYKFREEPLYQAIPEEAPVEQEKAEETQEEEVYTPLIEEDELEKAEDEVMKDTLIEEPPIPEPKQDVVEVKEEIIPVEPEPPAPVLEYRVQVLATREGPANLIKFRNKYDFRLDVKQDMFRGYYIYTLGSFETYDEARIYRDGIRNRYGITDAFVVAFENGNRLSKLP